MRSPVAGPVTGPEVVSSLASSCDSEDTISVPEVEFEGVESVDELSSSLSSGGSKAGPQFVLDFGALVF